MKYSYYMYVNINNNKTYIHINYLHDVGNK